VFLGSKKHESSLCLEISRTAPFIFIKWSLFDKINIHGFKKVFFSMKCFNELCLHNCKNVTIWKLWNGILWTLTFEKHSEKGLVIQGLHHIPHFGGHFTRRIICVSGRRRSFHTCNLPMRVSKMLCDHTQLPSSYMVALLLL
jgi:hypothetical protein